MKPRTAPVLMPDNGYKVATVEFTDNHQQVLGYDIKKVRGLADRINKGLVEYMVPRTINRGELCQTPQR
jgi:hypothetical protein